MNKSALNISIATVYRAVRLFEEATVLDEFHARIREERSSSRSELPESGTEGRLLVVGPETG